MADVTTSQLVTVKVYKRLLSNPAIVWANTYEVLRQTPGSTTPSPQDIASNLVDAEKLLHLPTVEFYRAVVSTLQPDSVPYDPASFVAIPLTGNGTRNAGLGDPEPLQMCLRIAKQVSTGRQGFALYRGCLIEPDVTAPAGVPILNGNALQDAVADYSAALLQYLGPAAVATVVLARTVAEPVRTVTAWNLGGVTVKKFNNRYFDRTNA